MGMSQNLTVFASRSKSEVPSLQIDMCSWRSPGRSSNDALPLTSGRREAARIQAKSSSVNLSPEELLLAKLSSSPSRLRLLSSSPSRLRLLSSLVMASNLSMSLTTETLSES